MEIALFNQIQNLPAPLIATSKKLSLSTMEQRMVLAAENTRINKISIDVAVGISYKIMEEAQVRLNLSKKDDLDIEKQQEAVLKVMLANGDLTTDEVFLVVERGLNGDFMSESDTFVHFTPSMLAIWIKKFKVERNKLAAAIIREKEKSEVVTPVPSEQESKRMSIEIANNYANKAREALSKGEPYIVPFGGLFALYKQIKKYGIWDVNEDEKDSLTQKIMDENPFADTDEIITLCQTQAYKNFIQELVDFGCKINQKGEVVPLDEQEEIEEISEAEYLEQEDGRDLPKW